MGQGNAANHACSPALLIGSCAPFSGKSAVVLGLARQLLQRGVSVRLGKPLADSAEGSDPLIDDDVRFVGQILGLKDDQLVPSVHLKDAEAARARLLDGNLQPGAGFQRLQQQLQSSSEGLTLMEASGSLNDGRLYGLSLAQVAEGLQAPVLLVHAWDDSSSVEPLLAARDQLG